MPYPRMYCAAFIVSLKKNLCSCIISLWIDNSKWAASYGDWGWCTVSDV